jgi:hypothetical protein
MGLSMADGGAERRDTDEDSNEIRVTDRRLFTRDGVLREEVSRPDEEEQERGERTPEPAERPQVAAGGFARRSLDEPSGVDFTMLVNAMAQPALIFLGEIAPPGTGRPEVNLEQARLQIDLLDLLRVRCRGNMSAEEEGLLEQILYQLRMLYVARSSPPG